LPKVKPKNKQHLLSNPENERFRFVDKIVQYANKINLEDIFILLILKRAKL
jgi:hypothetical protein